MSLVSGIVSGIFGNNASNDISDATESSNATQLEMFNRIVDLNQPRTDAGNAALGELTALYGLQNQQPQPTGGTGMNGTFGNFSSGLANQNYDGGGGLFGNLRRDVMSRFPQEGGQAGMPGFNLNGVNFGGERALPTQPNAQMPQQQTAQQAAIDRYYQSPDYLLAFDQGQDAIESSAAARGGLLSGATAQAVTDYGQDRATSTFGNYRNALNSIAGAGQVANQSTANASQNYANAFGNNAMIAGQAQANAANNWGQNIGSGINSFGNFLAGGFT